MLFPLHPYQHAHDMAYFNSLKKQQHIEQVRGDIYEIISSLGDRSTQNALIRGAAYLSTRTADKFSAGVFLAFYDNIGMGGVTQTVDVWNGV